MKKSLKSIFTILLLIGFVAFGFAQKVGKNGTLGISLMALDFGDIPVTTFNK